MRIALDRDKDNDSIYIVTKTMADSKVYRALRALMARGPRIIIRTIIVKWSSLKPCVIENRYSRWSNSRNSVALLLSAMNLDGGETRI